MQSNGPLKQNLYIQLSKHNRVFKNPSRRLLIQKALDNKEAILGSSGILATWTPPDSTGRSPGNTFIVQHSESDRSVDWTSPANKPISVSSFDALFLDAMKKLGSKQQVYVTNKCIGADYRYSLPVRAITDKALTALFTENMFRPIPGLIKNSFFYEQEFLLLALPDDKITKSEVDIGSGRLDSNINDMAVVVDMERKIGLVYGSSYCGSIKKLIFSVMNYLLPQIDVLPLHCSASVDRHRKTTLYLGLSGTGKTTLSTDPNQKMIGDDEHGWSDEGIANFENGCYAKLFKLDSKMEPEIHRIVTEKRHYLEHGCIVENAMMKSDSSFDFDDGNHTQNARVSYPLDFLVNRKKDSMSSHPDTIFFLTADAYGILPPISKLDITTAMLWFLMGYTSKLAGTETGIREPKAVFSRFFGEPFMPRSPEIYVKLFGQRLLETKANIYLVNTGWTGGPYGIGKRIDITTTRILINSALDGALDGIKHVADKRFHLRIPITCPGVDRSILNPRNTWGDIARHETVANELASKFSDHYDQTFANRFSSSELKKVCPGK